MPCLMELGQLLTIGNKENARAAPGATKGSGNTFVPISGVLLIAAANRF
jgi:hypothetical protein